MCDEMWDDNTEDIFESITIRQAMRTPSKYWGSRTKDMRARAKMALDQCGPHMLEKFSQFRSMPKTKSKTIKFRRYITNDDIQETLVGGLICQESITLGHKFKIGSTVGRNLSGYGDCTEFDISEG